MTSRIARFGGFALMLIATLLAVAWSTTTATNPAATKYRVVKTIPVGGNEGWDYLFVDAASRRVYVSHGTHVVVLDADKDSIIGDIPDTPGVHGIAVAGEFQRGFISDGRADQVTIFDLKTLKAVGTVKTGTNPDAIVFDPATKRVFTMNGRSHDTTAFGAADGVVAGTLPLGGKPEFAVADGKGSIFVNIEDRSELVQFDAQKLAIQNRWSLAPCESPSGLAMDLKTRRLFAGCDNKMMAVINADTGKVVTTLPIGEGVDADAFDPQTLLAFASTGDGNLTIVHEDSPDKFTVVQNLATKRSARTMGLDLKTHNIFLSAADFDPPAPGERRGKMKPDSFVILVVSEN